MYIMRFGTKTNKDIRSGAIPFSDVQKIQRELQKILCNRKKGLKRVIIIMTGINVLFFILSIPRFGTSAVRVSLLGICIVQALIVLFIKFIFVDREYKPFVRAARARYPWFDFNSDVAEIDAADNKKLKDYLMLDALSLIIPDFECENPPDLAYEFGYLFDIDGQGLEAFFKVIYENSEFYFTAQNESLKRIDMTDSEFRDRTDMFLTDVKGKYGKIG